MEHERKKNEATRHGTEEHLKISEMTKCPQAGKSENKQIKNGIYSSPAYFLPYE